MKVFEYLTPQNQVAQWIVGALLALFGIWCVLLLVNIRRCLRLKSEIKRCDDVNDLIESNTKLLEPSTGLSHANNDELFRTFREVRRLPESSSITKHLR